MGRSMKNGKMPFKGCTMSHWIIKGHFCSLHYFNSPIADADAITRIKECAEPLPPPRLHLLPPRITLPPPSIWQIHPHPHLTFLTLLLHLSHPKCPSQVTNISSPSIFTLKSRFYTFTGSQTVASVAIYDGRHWCDKRKVGRLRPNWQRSHRWTRRPTAAAPTGVALSLLSDSPLLTLILTLSEKLGQYIILILRNTYLACIAIPPNNTYLINY